jgi:rhodanese-related sulfurtransferase
MNPMDPRKSTLKTALALALASSLLWPTFTTAQAETSAAVIDEMAAYLEFSEYGGGVMFAEQIPREDWKRFLVIDTRDAAQYAKEHIPGAINIDWRQVLAQRASIPRDKPVLVYCNSGSLSAQAGFALRVAGLENVRILQGGFEEWKAKGGFDASTRATAPAKH